MIIIITIIIIIVMMILVARIMIIIRSNSMIIMMTSIIDIMPPFFSDFSQILHFACSCLCLQCLLLFLWHFRAHLPAQMALFSRIREGKRVVRNKPSCTSSARKLPLPPRVAICHPCCYSLCRNSFCCSRFRAAVEILQVALRALPTER